MGNNFFFERNFLGRKFWGACFGGADSLGEEILPAKFLENFLRVKSHSGEEKNTGKQKCFGGKIRGAKKFESKFLSLMVLQRTNLNTSIGKMLDVSYEPFSTLV